MPTATNDEVTDKPWKLRGLARQVALFAGVASLAGAVLAAGIDLYSDVGWGSPTLQAWTLLPQTASAAGLLFLGYRRNSKAFYILGALIALIVIEEAFHVLNPVSAWLADIARWANEWTDIRLSVLNGVLIYGLVALVGIAMLVVSHGHGSAEERPVVRNLALLLLVGGFFGGPVSMMSALGNYRRWIFIEEFGEALVFSVIVAYVAGIVVQMGNVTVDPRPERPLANPR